MKTYIVLLLCAFGSTVQLFAQTNDTASTDWDSKPTLTLSGFMDVYYAFDFNRPETSKRQTFLYNHNRHNEFNLNLGLLKLAVNHAKYRANVSFHAGTYVTDNYVGQPQSLSNFNEANMGISLGKRNKLWLDAGIFNSHIGFESAVSMDNWTLTRSLMAENSPYYLSGVKLTYQQGDRWEFAGILCNGWQQLARGYDIVLPSAGTQVVHRPSEKTMFNWSTFIGEDPNKPALMLVFSNLYGVFQLNDKNGLIVGFDWGMQATGFTGRTTGVWSSQVVIAQFTLSKAWKAAARLENYRDWLGVIIPRTSYHQFSKAGTSFNIDYSPVKNVVWRIESRYLFNTAGNFDSYKGGSQGNAFIVTSLAIRFAEEVGKAR